MAVVGGRQRELQTLRSVVLKGYQEYLWLKESYPKKLKEALEDAARYEIARWYAEYDPHLYNRQRGLYHAYKITTDVFSYDIEFGPEFMDEAGINHRATNEYIYNLAFMEGYHGGAKYVRDGKVQRGSEPHPNPGTPYWRTPAGKYTHWFEDPAPMGESPYERVNRAMDRVITIYEQALEASLNDILNRIERSINSYLRK